MGRLVIPNDNDLRSDAMYHVLYSDSHALA